MSISCLHRIENYWKLKTTNANMLFNNGKYKEALKSYKEALYRAEVLTINTKNCVDVGIPFIQVYMISCNNLANTYQELGDVDKATKMLKRSVYYLLHITKDNVSQIQEIQSELKRAIVNYFNFRKTTEQPDEEQLMLALKESLIF